MRASVLLALVALAALSVPSATADPPAPRVETILVIPGSHLDVGFTDLPSKVRVIRIRTLDAVIDAMDMDPEIRWTEEGGWVVHEWLAANAGKPDRISKARALVQAGKLGIGALYVNPHAALFSEDLHHLFAFHEEVEKAFGVRPKVAVINDVPSVPEALVDAAAAAGVEAFLCGPNLSFSPPFPANLVSGPFRWKSAKGNSVIVSIDPDSYTSAFTKWGIDPPLAKFMNKARFGALDGMAVAESGIAEMSKGRSGTVVVEQAFDNWGPEAALRLPAFAKAWNAAHPAGPVIRAAVPADALAVWKKMDLPVRTGEWGGTWEEVRAGCPETTHQLRRAAGMLPSSVSLRARLEMAVAMDHSGGLGPGWPSMFTQEQTVAHAKEWEWFVRRATGLPWMELARPTDRPGLAPDLRRRIDVERLPPGALPGVDAAHFSPSLRVAPISLGGPYFPAGSPEIAAPCWLLEMGDPRTEAVAGYSLFQHFDRAVIPGDESGIVDVGWDVPLESKAADVRAWPAGSPSAAAGKWLCGSPPQTFIAPEGLRVETPVSILSFFSPVCFAYRVADVGGRAHVQALLIRQTRLCTLKDGRKVVLPFADLYPGEPVELTAELLMVAAPRK